MIHGSWFMVKGYAMSAKLVKIWVNYLEVSDIIRIFAADFKR